MPCQHESPLHRLKRLDQSAAHVDDAWSSPTKGMTHVDVTSAVKDKCEAGKKKKKKPPFRVQRLKLLVEHGPAGIKCIAAFTSSQQTSPSKLGQRSTWMLRNQDDIREDCADVLETWFWNAGGRQPQFISMYWRCNKYFVCGVNYSFYGSVVYRLFEK